MICHIGKPLQKRIVVLGSCKFGWEAVSLCAPVDAGKQARSVRHSNSRSSHVRSIFPSLFRKSGRKFPVHCALNLQPPSEAVRLSSAFSGDQWLCCSTFGASAHVSGQNLLTFQGIYQQRRLADWHFERAQTWEDLLAAHEKWLLVVIDLKVRQNQPEGSNVAFKVRSSQNSRDSCRSRGGRCQGTNGNL